MKEQYHEIFNAIGVTDMRFIRYFRSQSWLNKPPKFNQFGCKALSAQDVQYMRGIVQSILVTDSKAMVEQALKSEDFRVKAAGCVLARRCGKEYLEELFEGLADDSDLVRQVSRESLHILNYMMTKKKIDFGPLPGEQSSVSACASQTLWKSHFRINENAANNKKIAE